MLQGVHGQDRHQEGAGRAVSNPYQAIPATILETRDETPNIRTFVLKPEQEIPFLAGQFIELTVPGFGEAPFTPSSSHFKRDIVEMTIMKVGKATGALFGLKPGDPVGVRAYGPGEDRRAAAR